jgi:hypothetical protein
LRTLEETRCGNGFASCKKKQELAIVTKVLPQRIMEAVVVDGYPVL